MFCMGSEPFSHGFLSDGSFSSVLEYSYSLWFFALDTDMDTAMDVTVVIETVHMILPMIYFAGDWRRVT